MKKLRKGFTLMEMLIVVAIIAILVAVSIPVFTSQLDKAREATCLANRRSLLAVVSITSLSEDVTQADAFAEEYSLHKDKYPCPLDGAFSWSDGRIICDKHSGGGEGSGSNAPAITLGTLSFVPEDTIKTLTTPVGESIEFKSGEVYKIDETLYVVPSKYTLTPGTDMDSFLNYYIRKLNQDKVFYADKVATANNKLDGNKITGAIGNLYVYGDSLYVQKKSFVGSYSNISTNPAESDYWALLGKLQQ